MSTDDDHPILAGRKLIESMRYGGYKNPAYALAELVDNSFEAGAKNVEILCEDQLDNVGQRNSLRLHQMAVIDDGDGMSQNELWDALTLGRGTRNARNGMGRFGMGLPYSSLSQCKRVDVYSWQNSDKIFHTYLDFDDIMKNNQRNIPSPEPKNIPDLWKNTSKILTTNSGTIVIWSKLDRCIWRRSQTIMRNSENLVGRIYRRLIHEKKLRIRMAAIQNGKQLERDSYIKPNDPLYQMVPSSTPRPWDAEKMFVLDGEKPDETFTVKDADGHDQVVKMRFAMATNKVRQTETGSDAGGSPHGKHASRNAGVSVIRADREVNLDQNLLRTFDTRERWWGAEIEFPPALDEFFGITNNKQEATNFSTMTKIIGARSVSDHEDDMPFDEVDDNDMLRIVTKLHARIRHMREVIDVQRKGSRSTKKDVDARHVVVNKANERRSNEGYSSKTGEQRKSESEDERTSQLAGSLEGSVPKDEIEGTVRELIQQKFEVYFTKATWNNSNFFDVSLDGGVQIIKINMNHNAHKNLISVVDDIPDDMDAQTAIKRLKDVQTGLSLLLASWARYEDEEPNPEQRKKIANVRFRWGEVLDKYLEM